MIKHSNLLICIFLFLGIQSFSQEFHLSGKIVDSRTKAPLAFVNIVVNNGPFGGISDIDGSFKLHSPDKIESLKISYVGYKSLTFRVDGSDKYDLEIKLEKSSYELLEVKIYPGINPAHRIINNVIANRDNNDPEKLRSFSYTSYDKMVITVDLDSLNTIDTSTMNINQKNMLGFFEDKDIFLMETVSNRTFLAPDRNYEEVVATKVSGFKDPIFVFLISQVQSTSFYKEMIQIANNNYINPISKGSTSKYYFEIRDTAYSDLMDTTFIISFRPLKNTNFDGLKGVLSISSHGWAIQNVKAKPDRREGGFEIRIQQMYELIDSNHWFPVQLNTDLVFFDVQQAGEKFDLLGIGKSYIRDIELNPEIIKRKLGPVGVDVDPNATSQKDDYWIQYRIDSLNSRDSATYAFVDSIGRANNFDKIAKSFEAVMQGNIPWKFVNIELDKIIKYNQYMGLYLGLGAHTNEKLSRFFSVGGYWGYGFKDQKAKYGGNLNFTLNRSRELKLLLKYRNDLSESGGVVFFDDNSRLLRPENFRNFLIRRENNTISYEAAMQMRVFKHFKGFAGIKVSNKEAFGDYQYAELINNKQELFNKFDFTELLIGTRFAFREKIIRTPRASLSLGTDYPVIWVQYTRGLKGVFNGDYDYNRIDLKVEKSFYTKYMGETTVVLKAGYIDSDLPYCNLYNGNGSYRVLTVFAHNSFATMRMNEFLSNRYIAGYFTHNFGKLLFRGEKFKPEFAIATNIAFGSLDNALDHKNVNIKTLELGYYESGLLINNILNLRLYYLGVGAFYRWGPYTFSQSFDNFAFKLSFVFPLQEMSSLK